MRARIAVLVMGSVVGVACAGCGGSNRAAPAVTITTTATVTTSVTVTATPAAVVAASELRACEAAHSLSAALVRSVTGSQTRFASCSWPPATGAGRDGYLILMVTDVSTGLDEASNESEYDLIAGPCTSFRVGYTFGDMGVHQILPLVTLVQGAVDVVDGDGATPVNLAVASAPDTPYPQRGQAIYLHNASYTVDSASCAS